MFYARTYKPGYHPHVPSRYTVSYRPLVPTPKIGLLAQAPEPIISAFLPSREHDSLSPSLSLNATKTVEMKLFFLLLRWLATAFLTALQIATVKIYQAKGNFTSAQKSAFNTIMLALALILGLNFLVSTTRVIATAC